MSRRMSCSMTVDAVRDRTKTVTRRHVDTWKNLQAGDRLTLIEKGMGLAKGERQVVLAEVEVVSVRVELLANLLDPGGYGPAEVVLEGFPDFTPAEFASLWAMSHGFPGWPSWQLYRTTKCRRIEWRYLDDTDT